MSDELQNAKQFNWRLCGFYSMCASFTVTAAICVNFESYINVRNDCSPMDNDRK